MISSNFIIYKVFDRRDNYIGLITVDVRFNREDIVSKLNKKYGMDWYRWEKY